MSGVLLTLNDNGTPVCHTEDTLDEWFRSLAPADKARIFYLEFDPEEERPELDARGIGAFLDRIDATERRIAEAYGAPLRALGDGSTEVLL